MKTLKPRRGEESISDNRFLKKFTIVNIFLRLLTVLLIPDTIGWFIIKWRLNFKTALIQGQNQVCLQ